MFTEWATLQYLVYILSAHINSDECLNYIMKNPFLGASNAISQRIPPVLLSNSSGIIVTIVITLVISKNNEL